MNRTNQVRMLSTIAVAVAMAWGSSFAAAAEAPVAAKPAQATQRSQVIYPTPEAAAGALYRTIEKHDVKSIYRVLGPGSEKLIYTGDAVADQQMRERFLAAYDKSLKIERSSDSKAMLLTGENESPFPFPLVKGTQGWRFDAKAGAEEIVNRRIGENELFAIKFCLAYSDAQREYAEVDRDGDRLIEYAQKFRSSEGRRDGLYWPAAKGEAVSPLGPLAARAAREGYSSRLKSPQQHPFHGYYFRILSGQGKDAPAGAYDYLVKGNMIGGYALVAYPASWGASGVMSFICSHDGVVYEKNLGAGTTQTASQMTRFNPDAGWKKAE